MTTNGRKMLKVKKSKLKQYKSEQFSKVYLADHGTVIDEADWIWLQENEIGNKQSAWLRGYKKFRKGKP